MNIQGGIYMKIYITFLKILRFFIKQFLKFYWTICGIVSYVLIKYKKIKLILCLKLLLKGNIGLRD